MSRIVPASALLAIFRIPNLRSGLVTRPVSMRALISGESEKPLGPGGCRESPQCSQARQGTRLRTRPEKPRRRVQRRPRRAGQGSERHPGQGGQVCRWAGRAIDMEFGDVEPAPGWKQNGSNGSCGTRRRILWGLVPARSHMARAEMRIRVSIFFDPPELDFRVSPSACRPNVSMTATALRTTSRPRRGLLLGRLVACPVPSQAYLCMLLGLEPCPCIP
jgi:hypothetical protein